MRKNVYSILFAVFAALFTFSALNGFSETPIQEVRYHYGPSFSLALSPVSVFSGHMTAEYLSINPNIVVEALFFLPLDLAVGPESLNKGAYNTLRGISSLRGIEYYSASRKKMRTFFKEAYVVGKMGDTKALPDPKVDYVPSYDSLVVFQEDLTFGKSYTIMHYRASGDAILVTMQNLTDLRYGPIKIIEKGGMITQALVKPVDNGLIFYGVCSVKALDIFGLAKSKSDSFYNRIAAFFSWFRDNLSSNF